MIWMTSSNCPGLWFNSLLISSPPQSLSASLFQLFVHWWFRIKTHFNEPPQFRVIRINRRFCLIQLAMRIFAAGKNIFDSIRSSLKEENRYLMASVISLSVLDELVFNCVGFSGSVLPVGGITVVGKSNNGGLNSLYSYLHKLVSSKTNKHLYKNEAELQIWWFCFEKWKKPPSDS